MRPLPAIALLALLTLLAVPAAQALAPTAPTAPPIVETRPCPGGYEPGVAVYVLGREVICVWPYAESSSAATPPLVEIKPCSGGAEGIYVAGRLVACFRDPIIPRGIVEVRDCPGPTQPGVGVYVLGAEVICIYPA